MRVACILRSTTAFLFTVCGVTDLRSGSAVVLHSNHGRWVRSFPAGCIPVVWLGMSAFVAHLGTNAYFLQCNSIIALKVLLLTLAICER
jgi:hypothetical protein